MSCSEVPSSGLGRASQPKRKGHFLFLDRCRLHLSKGVQRLARGSSALCLSRHDRVSYASTPVNELGQAG